MKICLISRYFDQGSGSAEWIYAAYIEETLTSSGIKVYLVSQKKTNSKMLIELRKAIHDWIIIPLKLIYYYLFCECRRFFFISENQAMSAWLMNMLGAATFSYFHDLMRAKNKKKITIQLLYFKLIYKLAAKSKIIIANSTSTKNDIIKLLAINPDKILIIPPIYRQFHPLNVEDKKLHRTIGYLGALSKRKRPEILCHLAESLNKLQNNNQPIEIHIWGKGELFEKLKTCARQNEIIKLMGFAPEIMLNEIFCSFDYFVMPSKYEGLGLPIIESSMCGVPCFVLADADLPDEVKTGCMVCNDALEISNLIMSLENNRTLYDHKSADSLYFSKRFDRDICFSQLWRVLFN